MSLPTRRSYLIGETAFHHEGDAAFLRGLIAGIARAGMDAVKFHLLFDIGDYMVERHPARPSLAEWTFGPDRWKQFIDESRGLDLDVVLLCNEPSCVDFVLDRAPDVEAIEVHATGINDILLLDRTAAYGGTVILGTGGCTMDEIAFAVDRLKTRGKDDIFLMHGFQNYPTDYADTDLSRLSMLRSFFRLPVGYADHTDPADPANAWISAAACMLGARVLEKHVTTVPGKKRTDGQAAVGFDRIPGIRSAMDALIAARGDSAYRMSGAEKKYGTTGPMKKAIVARRFIPAGRPIGMEDLGFRRTPETAPGNQRDVVRILGSRALRDIDAEEPVHLGLVDEAVKELDMSAFEQKEDS